MTTVDSTFEWTCTDGSKDLEYDDDDFVCRYNGLMLRAERMSIDSKNVEEWWWAVYDDNDNSINISNYNNDNNFSDQNVTSGAQARQLAEQAARIYLTSINKTSTRKTGRS